MGWTSGFLEITENTNNKVKLERQTCLKRLLKDDPRILLTVGVPPGLSKTSGKQNLLRIEFESCLTVK